MVIKMSKLKTYILNEVQNKNIDIATAKTMLSEITQLPTEDVAIVGISAILPQADKYEEFWQNMCGKIISIREFPKTRRSHTDAFIPQELLDDDDIYQRQGYLDYITRFDPAFFGLSDVESAKMSPLQRLTLECSWRAVDDAGYADGSLSGKRVSVLTANAQMGEMRYKDFIDNVDATAFMGSTGSLLSSRLAYKMGFTGECAIIDAACSSGLLAIHQACESLRYGEIAASVVCGSTINLLPISSDRVTILESPTSEINPFGSSANGTVWGEGVCAVMLKRLCDAKKDGDRIYAVICANGSNNDGTSNGITAPNMQRQKELLLTTWKRFNIQADKIGYIEAHGTGTRLGDPIEVRSISEAMYEYTKHKQFCAIGTCKANIGHLVATSGIAALIKCALSLYRGEIPPMPGFSEPNGYIDFCSTPLYVCDEKITIPSGDDFLIAINSFGISGTNVHLVLKAFDASGNNFNRPSFDNMSKSEYSVNDLCRDTKDVNRFFSADNEYYRVTLTRNLWFLREHCVLGRPTLPASAMLEMIYSAGQRAFDDAVIISDFTAMRLLPVDDKREIIIRTECCGEIRNVSILANNEESSESEYEKKWVPIATAKISVCTEKTAVCRQTLKGSHKRFNATELTNGRILYGDRWDCVNTVGSADGHSTIGISLGKRYSSDLNRHPLHPAMLDIALNGLSLTLDSDYLPFYIEKMCIYRPLGSSVTSDIYLNTEKSSDDIKVYDIYLSDKDGSLAEISGYSVKKINAFNQQRDCEYYTICWKKINDYPVDRKQNFSSCKCITASKEERIEKLAVALPCKNGEVIEVTNKQDVIQACESTDNIIFCISYTEQDVTTQVKDIIIPTSSILATIAASGVTSCTVVSFVESRHLPIINAIGTLIRSMSNEFLNMVCRHIIVEEQTDNAEIVREVLYGNNTECVVNGNVHFQPELCLCKISSSEKDKSNNGVYLLTGGSGGLAGVLAEKLCDTASTLILVSRSGKHSNKLAMLAAEKGIALAHYSIDVNDELQMHALIKKLKSENLEPWCIYHLAGIADGNFFTEYDSQKAYDIFAPKTVGAYNVYQMAKQVGAQRLIFISSVSALIGTPGQSVYSAANAYMDAMAVHMQNDELKTISIQLPSVTHVGMAAKNAADYNSVFNTITPEQAVNQIIDAQYRKTGIYCQAKLNYSFPLIKNLHWRLSRELRVKVARAASVNKDNKEKTDLVLFGREDCSYTETEIKLAAIWQSVLDCESVDIDAGFFESGGDSVMAISMAQKISDSFEIKFDMSRLFKVNTVRELAALIDQTNIGEKYIIPYAPILPSYPLSDEQRRIFAIQSIDPESIAYNIPTAIELEGNIEALHIEQAFKQVIAVSPSLRTRYVASDNGVCQEICDGSAYKLDIKRCNHRIEKKEQEEIMREFIVPFDLSAGILIKTLLIIDGEKHGYLILDVHHIAADGFSMSILLRNFLQAYSGLPLTAPRINYVDFTVWSLNRKDAEYDSARKYWHEQFADELPVMELPSSKERPNKKSYSGELLEFCIEPRLTKDIKKMAVEENATNGLIMLCAFSVMLAKYSFQDDIIIGVPYAGRKFSELENVIGMFVNTLPIRLNPDNKYTVKEYISRSKDCYVNSIKNSDYRIAELMSELSQSRDSSHNLLFDVMFAFQNVGGDIEITDVATPHLDTVVNNVHIRSVPFDKHISKVDLTLEVIERDSKFVCNLEYSTDLFSSDDAQRFVDSYKNVIRQFTENHMLRLSEVSVISESERNLVINHFNDTDFPFSDGQTVINLFEKQVERTPNATAVILGNSFITYNELNERANALAVRLRILGVKPDDFVAIMCERCIEMIIGIFGILKSGAAYLPILPTYPKDRVDYILQDSGAKVILLGNGLDMDVNGVVKISLSDLEQKEQKNPPHILRAENLAYMIYTSGTTGRPKGVMCHHRGLINRIEWMQRCYPIGSGDVILQKTTYTFDVSVWEIVWWSMYGAAVAMLSPGKEREPEAICDAIEHSKVSVMHFVPSMLGAFLSYLHMQPQIIGKLRSLKYVFASGEVLKLEHAEMFYSMFPDDCCPVLANFYGPTEASIDVTAYNCHKNQKMIPIGKPIDNIKLYILNGESLCGVGVPGELCITGVGVARGYLGLDDLTNERFCENMYGDGKIYHTGDIACWMPDGNIRYLGRADEQVKIRGIRIEPSEIERVLSAEEGIQNSAVIARATENGDKYLCAFFVASEQIDIDNLIISLKGKLPAYMIPSAFMQLERLPVTQNGKLNRKALPEIVLEDKKIYIEPETEEERVLIGAIAHILGQKNISVDDDFFRIGGDSIKGIQLSSYLLELGYVLKVQKLYDCSTIRDLALQMKKSKSMLGWDEVTGTAPLLPVQHAFFELSMPQISHFNQELICRCNENISGVALENALSKLVRHHDQLRASFSEEFQGQQMVRPQDCIECFKLNEYTLESDDNKQLIRLLNEGHESLQINGGAVFACVLAHTPHGDYLMFAAHHLVCDGISWQIILKDIEGFYYEEIGREKYQVQPKTTSYLDWCSAVEKRAETGVVKDQIPYWQSVCLPYNRDCNCCYEDVKRATFQLDKKTSIQLTDNLSKIRKLNINEAVICAFSEAVRQNNLNTPGFVMMESHGRENVFAELNVFNTVGWFTTVYPFILPSKGENILCELINTKEQFEHIPFNGFDYASVKKLSPELCDSDILINCMGDFSHTNSKLFKIINNIQGQRNALQNEAKYNLELNVFQLESGIMFVVDYTKKYDTKVINSFGQSLLDYFRKEAETLAAIEEISTPSDYGINSLNMDALQRITEKYGQPAKLYILSPMQKNIFTVSSISNDTSTYYERFSFMLNGDINGKIMKRAFSAVVETHDVFKTRFISQSINEVVQMVEKMGRPDFEISECVSDEQSEKEKLIQNDIQQGFDLANGQLIRMRMLKCSNHSYFVLLSFHHIILDGWGITMVLEEIFDSYIKLCNGEQPALFEKYSYSNYISHCMKKSRCDMLLFWKKRLYGLNYVPKLPFQMVSSKPYEQKNIIINLEQDIVLGLKAIANEARATESMVFQAVWALLLSEMIGNEVVFGYVVSGRDPQLEGVGQMLGLFINTIPLHLTVDHRETIIQLITRVRNYNIEAESSVYISIGDIVQSVGLTPEIIDNALVFENYPITGGLDLTKDEQDYKGMHISDGSYFEQSTLALSVKIVPGKNYVMTFRFDGGQYAENDIIEMAQRYVELLKQTADGMSIEMMLKNDNDILDDFNDDLE